MIFWLPHERFMADVITPNFGATGGGVPPVPPSDMTTSEMLFKIDKQQDTIDHLTMLLMAKTDELDKLLVFIKDYDRMLNELLTGHIAQAQNAKRAATALDAIRSKLLPSK